MRLALGSIAVVAALLAAGCAVQPPASPRAEGTPAPPPGRPVVSGPKIVLPATALSPEQQAVHALNRLGYGPRPGDLERVQRMGAARWIEAQLDPASIPDPVVTGWLAALPSLDKSVAELLRDYPRPDPAAAAPPAPAMRPGRITAELQAAKMLRAVWSERQLEEVLVDFWFNHFNIDARKATVRWMVGPYERDAIRPHALGRFRDLVLATARHPGMLFYLDNWLSVREDFVVPRGPQAGRRLGLNENYARELMELHTLGVDGGYTQRDVVEVARCFTGWTIDRPQASGAFVFRPGTHDQGAKQVLGHTIPAGGGEQDGVQVIDLLVRHPSTARFIATKLARRFVADDPPPAVVERAARAFRESDGDTRAVLAAIVTAPEFWAADAHRAKVKTPLEMVASAARVVGARPGGPGPAGGTPATPGLAGFSLARAVAGLGQPLYEAGPPTGHADRAEAWVNAGALLARMNFTLGLTEGRLGGVRADVAGLVAGVDRRRPAAVLDRLIGTLLPGEVSATTRGVLERQLGEPAVRRATADDRGPADTDAAKLAALVLGSPEFQRR